MTPDFIAKFQLRPLTLADKPFLTSFTEKLETPLAEHSFASWFLWGMPLNLHWKVVHGHLCLFVAGGTDMTLFAPPLAGGDCTAESFTLAVHHAFEIMNAFNNDTMRPLASSVEYVPESLLERFAPLTDTLELKQMGQDYIYDTRQMIELSGGAFKAKRHAKSKFMRDFPEHRVEAFTEAHKLPCRDLLLTWGQHRCDSSAGACSETNTPLTDLVTRDRDATLLALEHWQELNLKGLVVLIGSEVVGFTFGEALTTRQASILIEKTNPDFPGCPQFIFSEFCRLVWSDYPECNAGDDWGIPNLKFTKTSYRPIRLLKKYSAQYQQQIPLPAQSFCSSLETS